MINPLLSEVPSIFGGTQIIWTMNALKETDRRKFPYSKHRSKRITKKLIKRFGSEFEMEPCVFQISDAGYKKLIVHPSLRKEFNISP